MFKNPKTVSALLLLVSIFAGSASGQDPASNLAFLSANSSDQLKNEVSTMAQAKPVKKGRFPSYVMLTHHDSKTGRFEHTCSGAILSTKTVLTTAQCVAGQEDAVESLLVAPTVFAPEAWSRRRVKSYAVSHFCLPDQFDPQDPTHDDYALVHLDEAIQTDRYTKLARLGGARLNSSDVIYAVGPSERDKLGSRTSALQSARVTFVERVGQDRALFIHGNSSSCERDLGGQFYRVEDGQMELVGILTDIEGPCRKVVEAFDVQRLRERIEQFVIDCSLQKSSSTRAPETSFKTKSKPEFEPEPTSKSTAEAQPESRPEPEPITEPALAAPSPPPLQPLRSWWLARKMSDYTLALSSMGEWLFGW